MELNAVGFAARVFDADVEVPVAPMEVFEFDDFSVVYVPDSDDRGLWFGYDCDCQVDVEEGDVCDAEPISGLFVMSWI